MVKKRASRTRTGNNVATFTKRKAKKLTPNQKLILHLNEALAIENAAVQRLQSRIKQTRMENVKQRLQAHLEETKGQQDRLKQLISDLGKGQKNAATKDKAQLPIPTPPKSLTNVFGRMMTSAESELIAAKEDAIVENAEIILYDMLTHLAERMNAANAIAILSQSLSEERSMADWIKTNMPDMIAQLWPEIEASIATVEGE
ncbi:MAG: ferritin-like domain-containing protein [Nitrososphaeraceae archaeon]|jgi:ferritin-like metal-binding protein YciE